MNGVILLDALEVFLDALDTLVDFLFLLLLDVLLDPLFKEDDFSDNSSF